MTKLKTFVIGLSVLVMSTQTSLAEEISSKDIDFAFGASPDPTVTQTAASVPSFTVLSAEEMGSTQGEALPLFAVGALHAGRWITTRYVTRTVAANAARSGCSVMCFGTSQQARSLATQAYGRGNVLRHGPSGHVRSPVNYSHYQSLSGSPRGHIFYGSRLR